MAPNHTTNSSSISGGTHYTRHSFENADVRRSFDRLDSGEKVGDHFVDQSNNHKYEVGTGIVRDSGGRIIPRSSFSDWNSGRD